MIKLVRIWIALWFCSRLIFYCNADFSIQYPVNVWDEVYWFLQWFAMLFINEVWRHLLTLTNLSNATIRTCRSELFIFGFLFVSNIIWEIQNCINYQTAQSGLTQLIMFAIAGALIIIIVLKNTIE